MQKKRRVFDGSSFFIYIGKFFELPHEIKMLRKDAQLAEVTPALCTYMLNGE
jgi:hypothetical protein